MSVFWEIKEGDALKRLREMPDGLVQCCVTSPPYYGLRDYGNEAQIGLEATPDEYVARLVEVFSEVKRVLRDDGTLWLNLGDSYARNAGPRKGNFGRSAKGIRIPDGNRNSRHRFEGIKEKDLLGIPWLVAFALREDGWYLRKDVIWHKPNPMPESAVDRPTSAHEHVFLLAKSLQYYYDAEAIREPHTMRPQARPNGHKRRRPGPLLPEHTWSGTERDEPGVDGNPAGRHKRSVWTVPTKPYPEAHFATFPPKLIEPMVFAGCPRQACGTCGEPWRSTHGERVLDLSRPQARRARELADQHGLTDDHFKALRACGVGDAGKAQVTQAGFGRNAEATQALADEAKAALGGYTREFLLARPTVGRPEPSCEHTDDSGPGIVLDPFAGSGTTLQVAVANGRSAIGIELNPVYAKLIERRLAGVTQSMFDVATWGGA